jgi:YrbI family 3-deoxy-D-manno-octulosonate 8-phosphate phosphatase
MTTNTSRDIIKNIKLIIIDAEGALTSSLVNFDLNGNILPFYNILDMNAIKDAVSRGFEIGIISSNNTDYLVKFFKKIKLAFIAGKISNKLEWVKRYIDMNHLMLSQVAYVGYGLQDVELLKYAGISACPSNSHYKVLEISNYISGFKSGEGVIYEFLDIFNFNCNEEFKNRLVDKNKKDIKTEIPYEQESRPDSSRQDPRNDTRTDFNFKHGHNRRVSFDMGDPRNKNNDIGKDSNRYFKERQMHSSFNYGRSSSINMDDGPQQSSQSINDDMRFHKK